mmetsp:Transcript_2982/g.10695  ORF Transcript_2982/g.10695 Transcript_2982/m.10695 type:complete len:397 (+) Transcript_2982:48-1238(+)
MASTEDELRRLRRERPYGAADVFASLDYLSKTLYDRIDATQHQLVSSRAFFQGALAEHALWAPKKRQYFATLLLFLLLPLSLAASAAAVWYAVAYRSPAVGALVIAYATYIKLDTAPSHCSRPRRWARQNQISELIRDYFPIELRTATEDARGLFPADAVYLFGYHPHGVISVGCFMQFAFDTTGLSEKFKGLRFHAATLQANFYVPFFRELLLWLGIIDVSAESLRRALRSGPGAAVVVVPGGAAEALDARPGRCDLTLRKRSGFFRIALQHGAKLVPVYSFGENELYDRGDGEGSRAKALQAWLLKRLGYSAPFYLGAGSGVTGETMMPFSPVPRRHPIITVVGDPIPCPQIDDPTSDDIEAIKVLYINGLRSIFERFADKYTPSRTGDFNIVK